jgi:hypothetical protein
MAGPARTPHRRARTHLDRRYRVFVDACVVLVTAACGGIHPRAFRPRVQVNDGLRSSWGEHSSGHFKSQTRKPERLARALSEVLPLSAGGPCLHASFAKRGCCGSCTVVGRERVGGGPAGGRAARAPRRRTRTHPKRRMVCSRTSVWCSWLPPVAASTHAPSCLV